MSTIYSLASEGNQAASAKVRYTEKSSLFNAKIAAIVAVASLFFLGGSIVLGKHLFVVTITDDIISVGCFGGFFFGTIFATVCSGGVHEYLVAKRAQKQFSKPLNEMDPAYRNELIEDLTGCMRCYEGNRRHYAQEKLEKLKNETDQKVTDYQALLAQLKPSDVSSPSDERKKKILTALQITALVITALLAIGCFALCAYGTSQATALGIHSFSSFDTLSIVAITALPLVIHTGKIIFDILQDKKKRLSYHKSPVLAENS